MAGDRLPYFLKEGVVLERIYWADITTLVQGFLYCKFHTNALFVQVSGYRIVWELIHYFNW